MTRDEFLARCELIYDTGHARPEVLGVLARSADALMRYVHYAASAKRCTAEDLILISQRGHEVYWRMEAARQQKDIFDNLVEQEVARIEAQSFPETLMTLANDGPGYAAVEFMAILTHHCQLCATDPHSWWTRPGFCSHRRTP